MRVVQSSHLLPPKYPFTQYRKIITKKISEFSIEIVHAFMEKEALQREIATLKSRIQIKQASTIHSSPKTQNLRLIIDIWKDKF